MRSLILSSLLFTFALSAPIGGVAILVKNNPITLYEVIQEMKESGADATKSADVLIRKKLEELEAQEKKIAVTASEIKEEMERMAKQNNLTVEQFLDAMRTARSLSESDLKAKVEESIRGQKLYSSIAMSKTAQPTPAEEADYYGLNLDEFSHPDGYDVTLYMANSAEALQAKIEDPMYNVPNISTKDEKISAKNINPQLAQILNKIEVGKFGPILPNGKDSFMSFYMKDKQNMVTENLDAVRPQIANIIMGEKRNQVLNDYFTRLRLSADIKIIRLP